MQRRAVWGTIVCLICLLGSMAASPCELPAGTMMWLRLSTSVSSYSSKPGNPVSAVLTEDLVCKDGLAVPAGTPIAGQVRAVKKVGWGFRHETASLRLEFNQLKLADESTLDLDTRLLEVENSRETVKNGVIQGIRSTDTPQGRINSRLKHLPTWNPYSDAFLIAYKATFPIFPEPEIWYGPGTDMRLELTAPLQVQTLATSYSSNADADRESSAMTSQLPQHISTLKEKDADVVNLAFLGSREQLQSAFLSAGWVGSDKLSKTSFLREFSAFLDHSGYATAPMRPMLLAGAPPDMLWQKSLNTYSKRDHLRIWRSTENYDGTPVWVGAATHDAGATLSLRNKRFVHTIDPDIDQERAKIIRDLKMAGCVQSVQLVERPDVAHLLLNADGDPIKTDGKLALVQLQDCSNETSPPKAKKYKPGNVVFRYLRRQVLTLRSDIWRANIIYGAYDVVRMLGHAAHDMEKTTVAHREARANQQAALVTARPAQAVSTSGESSEPVSERGSKFSSLMESVR